MARRAAAVAGQWATHDGAPVASGTDASERSRDSVGEFPPCNRRPPHAPFVASIGSVRTGARDTALTSLDLDCVYLRTGKIIKRGCQDRRSAGPTRAARVASYPVRVQGSDVEVKM
jgi:hypothetical protein